MMKKSIVYAAMQRQKNVRILQSTVKHTENVDSSLLSHCNQFQKKEKRKEKKNPHSIRQQDLPFPPFPRVWYLYPHSHPFRLKSFLDSFNDQAGVSAPIPDPLHRKLPHLPEPPSRRQETAQHLPPRRSRREAALPQPDPSTATRSRTPVVLLLPGDPGGQSGPAAAVENDGDRHHLRAREGRARVVLRAAGPPHDEARPPPGALHPDIGPHPGDAVRPRPDGARVQRGRVGRPGAGAVSAAVGASVDALLQREEARLCGAPEAHAADQDHAQDHAEHHRRGRRHPLQIPRREGGYVHAG